MKTQIRFSLAVLAVAVSMILSGCNGDASSPDGVLELMGNAVRSGSLATFQSCLTGDALKQNGNAASLHELRRETLGLELSLGDAVLLSEQSPREGIVIRTYDVPVLGRKAGSVDAFAKFMDAQVVCETGGATQEARVQSAFFMVPSPRSTNDRHEAPVMCRISELTP